MASSFYYHSYLASRESDFYQSVSYMNRLLMVIMDKQLKKKDF